MEVKLHTKAKTALKAASLHTFKNFSIIDEQLVQTNHFLPTIVHYTPIAIGVTILELVRYCLIIWHDVIHCDIVQRAGNAFIYFLISEQVHYV